MISNSSINFIQSFSDLSRAYFRLLSAYIIILIWMMSRFVALFGSRAQKLIVEFNESESRFASSKRQKPLDRQQNLISIGIKRMALSCTIFLLVIFQGLIFELIHRGASHSISSFNYLNRNV